ncbi:hypothetical protein [Microscilla marina]|uniref:hypothetical protein n=1 Tax=Microscilla marina TaxID=1027 RepID=UPI0005D47D2E|nr:hypothetical protein [Microscilla marina]
MSNSKKKLNVIQEGVLSVLGPTPINDSTYLRSVNVTIDNKIKELPKNVQWNITIMSSLLYPTQGTWEERLEPGTQLDFGGDPLIASASNTTYPQGVRGFIRLNVFGNNQATINFSNQISEMHGDVNGQTYIYVGNILFSVENIVRNGILNVNVTTIKYCQ